MNPEPLRWDKPMYLILCPPTWLRNHGGVPAANWHVSHGKGREESIKQPGFVALYGGRVPGGSEGACSGEEMKSPLSQLNLNPTLEQQRSMIEAGLWAADEKQILTLLEALRKESHNSTLSAAHRGFGTLKGVGPVTTTGSGKGPWGCFVGHGEGAADF